MYICSMKKILAFYLSLFFIISAFGGNKPVLIVGIQVSGLREDYLNMFMSELGNQGFKRLISEGTTYNNLYFPYHYAGESADQASLSTGATPYSHGICTNAFYNPKSYKMQSFMQDNAVKGVNGSDNFSAASQSAPSLGTGFMGCSLANSSLIRSKPALPTLVSVASSFLRSEQKSMA